MLRRRAVADPVVRDADPAAQAAVRALPVVPVVRAELKEGAAVRAGAVRR